ncbi:MAG: NAD(P)-binding domain-containing protein [Acidobacteria bacterium]|nr:NAD(P)-binding domain-containing protein [Acidobacteriota bacterium]MBV9478815.1 NAD(P)-binding domain-containing protein [Acidobacteriota bacterium]
MPKRVAVIGGGPSGIAAALGALARGHDVALLERDAVGASLRTWGATRFFSPLSMNVTPRMRELLDADFDGDALLTGAEYADRVLAPLAAREPLHGRVFERHEVIAIGRRGLTRGDYAGHPLRAERLFRIVCANDAVFEADVVLDASGGLRIPRAFGLGGLPVLGEPTLAHGPIRTLGALADACDALRGKRVLVVGGGHSAAHAIVHLSALAEAAPSTRIVWAVRGANRRPCEEVVNDPLPERRAVVERANELASAPPEFLRVERRAMVERVAQHDDRIAVTLTGGRAVDVDAIAAFTGYRPDAAFLTEIAAEVSPVTEGGARLARAIANVTDCLSVPSVAARDLESGEPGFYFAGSRGYGRSKTFLLQTGFAQLERILDAVS